ncbi:MAG: sugar ABC transporter permease [Acuticoccus sp.]
MARPATADGRFRPLDPTMRQRQLVLSYSLLLPAALAVVAVIVYPLYQVVDLSLREGQIMNFAKIGELPLGFANYARALSDPNFWNAAFVSAVYVGGTVGFGYLVALGTALLLNEDLPGNRLLRTLVLVPWAVPGIIVGIMFLWILDSSYGVFNAMLRDIGLLENDFPWFVDRNTALGAVIVPAVWKTYPLITLTILAALQSIPDELYEAANVDGATRIQKFRYITWAGIRGPSMLVMMIAALGTFRDVDILFGTTGGGPARATETLALYVYKEAFHYFQMGTAAAVGTIMVLIAMAVGVVLITLASRSRF